MTFQFLCPQGHLLQGDEAHMGMQCQCPQCGTAFIIPTVGQSGPTGEEMTPRDPVTEIEVDYPSAHASSARTDAAALAEAFELSDRDVASSMVDENLVHIPCPNGHELETPLDMIGQRVMCPQCGVEFRLKREQSVEYLRQQEILERRRAKFWFQLAVLAASFVGVVLVAMIVISSMSR